MNDKQASTDAVFDRVKGDAPVERLRDAQRLAAETGRDEDSARLALIQADAIDAERAAKAPPGGPPRKLEADMPDDLMVLYGQRLLDLDIAVDRLNLQHHLRNTEVPPELTQIAALVATLKQRYGFHF